MIEFQTIMKEKQSKNLEELVCLRWNGAAEFAEKPCLCARSKDLYFEIYILFTAILSSQVRYSPLQASSGPRTLA